MCPLLCRPYATAAYFLVVYKNLNMGFRAKKNPRRSSFIYYKELECIHHICTKVFMDIVRMFFSHVFTTKPYLVVTAQSKIQSPTEHIIVRNPPNKCPRLTDASRRSFPTFTTAPSKTSSSKYPFPTRRS